VNEGNSLRAFCMRLLKITHNTPEELVPFLCGAGFSGAWFETKTFSYGKGICVLGEK
jgi:hypothetical protein